MIKSGKTWTFDKVNAVEVVRSSELLTDTCTIVLPKKTKWQAEENLPIKIGDGISVSLGYDDENTEVFVGYITKIGAKTPIVIECQDEMWKLKITPVVCKAYRSASIKGVLTDQNLPYEVKVLGEQNLGEYRVTANTVAELLHSWKEQGIRSFFKIKDGKAVLYCGVAFEPKTNISAVFHNQLNIISDDDLNEQNIEDIKIKLVAISLDSNNKKTKVEVGDKEGEIRTLHTYGKSKSELEAWAKQELQRLKKGGISGSFETFGAQIVDKLDLVGLKLDGVKKGIYQVQKNTISYSDSGFRQRIELGAKIRD
ncbi:MAG: hypothetical protein ACRC3G_05500 [Bacteroidales bacterium]